MKVIIIDHEPYTLQKKERYFIDYFVDKNIAVEYWCVQEVLDYSKIANYEVKLVDGFVKNISTRKEIIHLVKEIDVSNTFVFFECRQNLDTFYLLELFYTRHVIWGRIEYFHNPTIEFLAPIYPNKKMSYLGRFLAKVKNYTNRKWIKYYMYRKFNNDKLIKLNTSYLSFITGNNIKGLLPSRKYVSIDYFDIVKFKEEDIAAPKLNYDYAVFGDVYLGRHPDLQIMYGDNYIDLENYYAKMNSFFDRVEQVFGFPVVIAAHPKSNYTNEFGNRLVLKDCSTNLIINSKLFMSHCSLSVCNAMLSYKKILQLSSNEFLVNDALKGFSSIMDRLHGIIKAPIMNIDQEVYFDDFIQSEIPITEYEMALDAYFRKSDLESVSNEEIVYDNIVKLTTDENAN